MSEFVTPSPELTAALVECIDAALTAKNDGLLVVGLCGSQGSGKSTLAGWIEDHYRGLGWPVAVLSLDDLYLPKAEREALGREVHPLLRTRGVPGTHDVALGLATLEALSRGEGAYLPRFDKARDDRKPRSEWTPTAENCRLLIFEGWCVGALPQPVEDLAKPVNTLERMEDADGIWRRYANEALATSHRRLFAPIDVLALLAAPSFDVVLDWRMQQEDELRARVGADAPAIMDEDALARFVSHYERLTRHILAEMPGRADIVVRLDRDRRVSSIEKR